MIDRRRDLTIGEVVRMIGFSATTIQRFVDVGALAGYRVPGRGRFRRIPIAELRRFAAEHDIPIQDGEPDASARHEE